MNNDILRNVEHIKGDKFPSLCNGKDIIFCQNINLYYLFYKLESETEDKVIVVHNAKRQNSDMSLNQSHYDLRPFCVKKVFSLNVDLPENEYFECMPIGAPNSFIPALEKFSTNVETILNTEKKYKNLAYINFKPHTHNKRPFVWNYFKNKDWVTYGKYFRDEDWYNTYLRDMFNHKFVISPRGNGIDTHRTWEALYLGSIPIMLKNNVSNNWKDLPVLLIDDWEQVTESFLNEKFKEYQERDFDYRKLDFKYWSKRIKNSDTN